METTKTDKIILTDHQQDILNNLVESVLSGQRVNVLTGAAGTGKTTLMKEFIYAMERKGKSIQLTATTHQAAFQLQLVGESQGPGWPQPVQRRIPWS